MEDIVLHVNRELIRHGAEFSLPRDLYLRQPLSGGSAQPSS